MGVTFKLCHEVLMKYYGRPEDLDALYITMCVLNGLLALTAIMGNVLIISALKKASTIPLSTRILLLCLALTDLTTGIFGHPLYIAVISRIRQNFACDNIHEVLLVFFILSASLVAVSFITVIIIGMDRFLAITLHLRYNELVTPKRVILAVVSAWLFSLTTVFICVFCYFQVGEIVFTSVRLWRYDCAQYSLCESVFRSPSPCSNYRQPSAGFDPSVKYHKHGSKQKLSNQNVLCFCCLLAVLLPLLGRVNCFASFRPKCKDSKSCATHIIASDA